MDLFNTIVTVFISFLVITTPIWIIAGIVLIVVSGEREDLKKKKKFKWWGIICCVLPFVLLFFTLSIWGLIRIVTGTAGI